MVPAENNNLLLLFASNYKKEYISDIVEALGVPTGFIIHFRYRKKWIHPVLWDEIPLKEAPSQKPPYKVLIVYLFQKEDGSWEYAYPIRYASIDKWYRTGKKESDVAHFYLSMSEYCSVKTNSLLTENSSLASSKIFAVKVNPLSTNVVDKTEDTKESAFYQLVDSIKSEHFKTIEDSKQYYPVFHYISGFRETKSNQLQEFEKGYNLTEGKEYVLETSIRFTDKKLPGTSSNIKLSCYEKRFENKQELVAPVTTYYDEFTWRLVPSSVIDNRKTTVTLATNIELKPTEANNQDESVLNVTFDLPVTILPDSKLKVISTVSDTSLLVATSTIAFLSLSKTLKPNVTFPEWPGYIVALAYLIGVITKIYLRWRGK
jgi:hypothetical protein